MTDIKLTCSVRRLALREHLLITRQLGIMNQQRHHAVTVSVVGTVSALWARRSGVQIPAQAPDISVLQSVVTGSRAHTLPV